MWLRGENMMILCEQQMKIALQGYFELKHNIENHVRSVTWSEREQGFCIDFEPKEGPIFTAKRKDPNNARL